MGQKFKFRQFISSIMDNSLYTSFSRVINTCNLLKNPIPLLMDYMGLKKRGIYILESKYGEKYKLRYATSDRFIFCENLISSAYFNMGQQIKPGDIIIDIGANFGIFSIKASQYNPKKIYAIEPSSDNYEILRENLYLNRLSNVLTYKIAIGSYDGITKLYTHPTKNAFHSICEEVEGRSPTRYELVSVKTLDTFFKENNIQYCNYLKMDCEGAEHDILNNSHVDIFRRIEQITMEIHEVDGRFIEDVIDQLINFGYEIISQKWRVVYAKRKKSC